MSGCVVEGSENGGVKMGEYKWGKVLFCVLYSVVFSVMYVLQVLCCVLMCVAGCVVLYSEL